MVFVVYRNELYKNYGMAPEWLQVYILGIYTNEESAKERYEKEREKEHDDKCSKLSVFMTEMELNKNIEEDVSVY